LCGNPANGGRIFTNVGVKFFMMKTGRPAFGQNKRF